MYIGIDIGGTKTLVATLTGKGVITESIKFPTPHSYDEFLDALATALSGLKEKDFRAGCVAAPGRVNRAKGAVERFGNLPWKDVPLQADTEKLTHCPMLIENDANLAGLSEAMLLKDKHQKVLYITVSTGIGTGFIVDQKIDPTMADSEGGKMMLQRGDKIVEWESFASGHAVSVHYGKQASEIIDPAIWKAVSANLAVGIIDLLAVTQPDIIVIGGGMGHYLERFEAPLVAELKRYENPMVPIPPIVPAGRPDEAVIYGCYDLARSSYA